MIWVNIDVLTLSFDKINTNIYSTDVDGSSIGFNSSIKRDIDESRSLESVISSLKFCTSSNIKVSFAVSDSSDTKTLKVNNLHYHLSYKKDKQYYL